MRGMLRRRIENAIEPATPAIKREFLGVDVARRLKNRMLFLKPSKSATRRRFLVWKVASDH
jgi:hypothetical protein